MKLPYICPGCERRHFDDWPLLINGVVNGCGCQECWEAQTSKEWWEELEKIHMNMEQREILNAMMDGEITVDDARDRLDEIEYREQSREYEMKRAARRAKRRVMLDALKDWFSGLFRRFA